MTMQNDIVIEQKQQAVLLKGSLFTLTVVQLFTTQYEQISENLSDLANKLPNFFAHTPVVIDCQKLPTTGNLNFLELKEIFLKHQLIPVGVRGANADANQAAIAAGFAIMPLSKDNHDFEVNKNTPLNDVETTPQTKNTASINNQKVKTHSPKTTPANYISPTRIITQPVRSGQQVYAKNGDLVVLASVSHGAELLADGNIHVYGALRGRALAGIRGDKQAKIFCQQLEAELISIAGYYMVKENLIIPDGDSFIHIYLDDKQVQITQI